MRILLTVKSARSKKVLLNIVKSFNSPNDSAEGIPKIKIEIPIIHDALLRLALFPLAMTETIISNIEKADVNAANRNIIRKATKNNIPNGNWLKIVGRTLKSSTGPASGERPNENTAGKIAKPAKSTMAIFIPTMDNADLGKL